MYEDLFSNPSIFILICFYLFYFYILILIPLDSSSILFFSLLPFSHFSFILSVLFGEVLLPPPLCTFLLGIILTSGKDFNYVRFFLYPCFNIIFICLYFFFIPVFIIIFLYCNYCFFYPFLNLYVVIFFFKVENKCFYQF